MNSLKVLRFVKNHRLINYPKRGKVIKFQFKSLSLTPKLCEDSKSLLNQLEHRFKKISENVDQSSPLKPFIDRLMSKPWITFFGEKTKTVPIKERKEAKSLKDGMFRMAFDLAGFKAEDIHIIVSNTKLYIEAKREETTKDGSMAWREFSYQCNIDANVNPNSITAQFDSEGLLVIDGEAPKESISGVKKGKQ